MRHVSTLASNVTRALCPSSWTATAERSQRDRSVSTRRAVRRLTRARSAGRLLVVVALVALVLPVHAGGVSVVSTVERPADSTAPDVPQVSETTPGNNSTVQHRNPAEIREFGDSTRLRQWISNDLENRLSRSAIQLREGEYRRARAIVGDRYSDRLGQYVDILGETSTDTDDESVERYRESRRSQRNLTQSVQRYERAYDEYQRALANGNESKVRQTARRLGAIETRVQRLNRSAQRDYRQLENQTGSSLTETRRAVANVSRNISARQTRLESELFVEVDLQLEPADRRISYTDPLIAHGRLVTAEGKPVGNREITLVVRGRRQQVATNISGYFDLRYRPRTTSVDRSAVTVTYRPNATSEYQSASTAVEVRIEQVTADLSVTVEPETAAYGENVTIGARLTVDGEPVSGVPINATVGDYRVSENPISRDGNGTRRVVVPATVTPGQRSVTVTAGNGSTAVRAANATASLVVPVTETNVSLGRTTTSSTELRVGGRLVTVRGAAIGGQPVVVSVGDVVERPVQTSPNGAFNLSVSREQLDPAPNGTVLVSAQYGGDGRNLNRSVATLRVQVGPGTGSSGTGLARFLTDEWYVALGVATLSLLLGTLLIARRRFGDTWDEATDASVAARAGEVGTSDDGVDEQRDVAPDGLDLTPGESFLDRGNETAAVRYTYQHLREHVSDSVNVDRTDTHWEFFDACRNDGINGSQLETLRALVEAFEQVSFLEDSDTDLDVGELLRSVKEEWGSGAA